MASPSASGWVVYHPFHDLSSFLRRHRPSEINDPALFWVSVQNPQCKEESSGDESYAQALWNKLRKELDEVDVNAVKGIANASGVTSGKWMIFRKSSEIDDVWSTVAKACIQGELGHAVKVSTKSSSSSQYGKNHIICVYTKDFTDESDVMQVEQKLRHLGISGQLKYKPDIYTYLGIYFNNPWNIKPCLYTTEG